MRTRQQEAIRAVEYRLDLVGAEYLKEFRDKLSREIHGGNESGALKRANERYSKDGSDAAALVYVSLLIVRGLYDEAEDILNKISVDGDLALVARLLRADLERFAGSFESAAELVEEAEEQLLGRPVWSRFAAEIMVAVEEEQLAAKFLEAVRGTRYFSEELQATLFQLYFDTEQWEKARAVAEDILDKEPGRLGVWEKYAAICHELGDWLAQLEADFEVLRKRGGENEEWHRLGLQALDLGEYETAEKIFRRLTERAPLTPDYWMELGEVQLEAGKYEEAASNFERATEYGADEVEANLYTGLAAVEMGDLTLAEEMLESLPEVEEAGAVSYLAGKLYLKKGEYDKTVESLEAILEGGREEPELNWMLAVAYLHEGAMEEGFSQFERYLRFVDKPEIATFEYAQHILWATGEVGKIDEMAQVSGLRKDPTWEKLRLFFELFSADEEELVEIEESFVGGEKLELPGDLSWERLDRLSQVKGGRVSRVYETMKGFVGV